MKLNREERRRVNRMRLRMLTLERKEFPSSSNEKVVYDAVVMTNGKLQCNCFGWTRWASKSRGKPRQCRHTEDLRNNRPVRTDGEFQYIVGIAAPKGDE